MRTRIRKWGNSLALRIPRSFALETGIEQGAEVDLTLREGQLVVSMPAVPQHTLAELLEQVTDENLHAEVDTGAAMGREAW